LRGLCFTRSFGAAVAVSLAAILRLATPGRAGEMTGQDDRNPHASIDRWSRCTGRVDGTGRVPPSRLGGRHLPGFAGDGFRSAVPGSPGAAHARCNLRSYGVGRRHWSLKAASFRRL